MDSSNANLETFNSSLTETALVSFGITRVVQTVHIANNPKPVLLAKGFADGIQVQSGITISGSPGLRLRANQFGDPKFGDGGTITVIGNTADFESGTFPR